MRPTGRLYAINRPQPHAQDQFVATKSPKPTGQVPQEPKQSCLGHQQNSLLGANARGDAERLAISRNFAATFGFQFGHDARKIINRKCRIGQDRR